MSKSIKKKISTHDSDNDSGNDVILKKKSKNKSSKESKTNNKLDRRILEIKTTKTAAFKQVIERISNVISDCSLVFIPADDSVDDQDDYYEEISGNEIASGKSFKKKTPSKSTNSDNDSENDNYAKPSKSSKKTQSTKKNTGGMRILRLTEDKSILIKLNLDANKFDYFKCDEPKITIGVDMHIFHGLLKMISDAEPIILYMNRDNRSVLHISSLNENNENSEGTDLELYLMDISNPDIPILPTEFQNKIAMASDKFHSICKHLNNNSTYVEITSINNEILFRGQNEGGKATKTYRDTSYNPKKQTKSDQLVQGVYELRNLMCFSKCNKLCQIIEIYLKNDFPLVLAIQVATLGKMFVFLSPIETGNQ